MGFKQAIVLGQVELEVCIRLSKSLGAGPSTRVSPIGSIIVKVISLSQFPE